MRRFIAAAVAVVAAGCGGSDDVGGVPAARRCPILAPARGVLHADGTRIVDALGRTISLRGVNTGGRAKFAPYAPFAFDPAVAGDFDAKLALYLDRAASWGIDVLRVPYSWQAAEPTSGAPDEAYLARYDALLDAAWAHGLWTIVDFHQDIYAEPYCGDGFPSWTIAGAPPAHHDCPGWSSKYDSDAGVRAAFDALWSDAGGARTKLVAMWEALAAREKDRAGVIGYEPINEPHGGTADRETWERDTLAPFYTDLAARLRARDPDALVFVDTTGYEGVIGTTGLPRPAGDGLVLAPHYYDTRALFGGKPDPDVTSRLKAWADRGATWNVPVLIGEMGLPVDNPYAAVHARHHLDALDALAIGGTWWEYSVSSELWNSENFSIVGADGTETAIVGELARPYARALAGTASSIAYDADARRYTIVYAPAGDAPTELAIPTRDGAVRIGAIGACVDEESGVVFVQPDPGAAEVTVAIETQSVADMH